MVIDAKRRLRLRAMGIDVWERRALRPAPIAIAPVRPEAIAADGRARRPALPPDAGLSPPPPAGDPAHAARVAALDWNALAQCVSSCRRCDLHRTRTQTVFGVGDRQAQWFLVGEAPGADEDRQGEPFVGRAGQLLNSMLVAVGLQREAVYIANVMKCRPPNNRDPGPDEVQACQGYLERQIRLVQPRIILAVGRVAAQNLLGVDTAISRMRGQRHVYRDTGIPVVVTYHPAYLLRAPQEKRKAWADLLFARSQFEAEA